MDLYTFFVCKADGSSTMFDMCELPSRDAVAGHAMAMLEEHACAYIAAWCGDRPVLTRHRLPQGPKPIAATSDEGAYP